MVNDSDGFDDEQGSEDGGRSMQRLVRTKFILQRFSDHEISATV